jgi:hypothetical protein
MPEIKIREELERELRSAEEELEEVEDMKVAILGQTGVHIGARELQRHHSRFDGDQRRLSERIAQIKDQLASSERN